MPLVKVPTKTKPDIDMVEDAAAIHRRSLAGIGLRALP